MIDLIEEAAKAAYETRHLPNSVDWDDANKSAWHRVAEGQRDFWAAHAEPVEMDTATILRKAAEHIEKMPDRLLTAYQVDGLRAEASRLDREQRENARDVAIGRAISKFIREDWTSGGEREVAAALGKAAREAVEADQ